MNNKVDVDRALESAHAYYRYNIEGLGGIAITFHKTQKPENPAKDYPHIYSFPVKPSKDRKVVDGAWVFDEQELLDVFENQFKVELDDKKRQKISSIQYPIFIFSRLFENIYDEKMPKYLHLITVAGNDVDYFEEIDLNDVVEATLDNNEQTKISIDENKEIENNNNEFSLEYNDDLLLDDNEEFNVDFDLTIDTDDDFDDNTDITEEKLENGAEEIEELSYKTDSSLENSLREQMDYQYDVFGSRFNEIDEIEAQSVSEYLFNYKVGNVYDIHVFTKDGDLLGARLGEYTLIPEEEDALFLADIIVNS